MKFYSSITIFKFIFSTLLLSNDATASYIPLPLTNSPRAIYSHSTPDAAMAASAASIQSFSKIVSVDISVGFFGSRNREFLTNAQKISSHFQYIFTEGAGADFLSKYPEADVSVVRIYSDTNEAIIKLSIDESFAGNAYLELIEILKNSPAIKFTGLKRSIRVDQ